MLIITTQAISIVIRIIISKTKETKTIILNLNNLSSNF